MNSLKYTGKDVDIVFSFDTTGRMYNAIQELSKHIDKIVDRLFKDISLRIGFITHGDYGDDELGNGCIRTLGLTSSGPTLAAFVGKTPKTHGEDAPECYEYVLRVALQAFAWSKQSPTLNSRALVLVGDDVPHAPSHTSLLLHWRDELRALSAKGVKVYAVQARSNRHAKPFYVELSQATQGTYLNVKDFELLPYILQAICYKEASEDMLAAYLKELDNVDLPQLKSTLSPLVSPDEHALNYSNILPLIANTAWWNPKLYDNAAHKPAFVFDTISRKFIRQQKEKKDGESVEQANASHLINTNTNLSSITEDDEMALDFSFSPFIVNDQFDSQFKKIRLDTPSASPVVSASSPSMNTSANNNTPANTSSIKRPVTRGLSNRRPSRRLINDNDDDDNEPDHFNFEPLEFNNNNSPNINNNNDVDYTGINESNNDITTNINNNNSPMVFENSAKGYRARLTKGRPRRASSFAFGDVAPSSTPLTLFASPSILESTKQFPFDSPIEDSGVHSDPETERKRKATWNPPSLRARPERRIVVKAEGEKKEPPKVGQMTAVRAEGGGFWLAKVVGARSDDHVDVQWLDEIKSHMNFFVQLDWYDTINVHAILKSRVKVENLKKIGVYKLPELEKQSLHNLL